MPWMVVDMSTPEGMEGVYAGTYEDCQAFLYEQSQYCSFGMEIVPNPYYQKRNNIQLKPIVP